VHVQPSSGLSKGFSPGRIRSWLRDTFDGLLEGVLGISKTSTDGRSVLKEQRVANSQPATTNRDRFLPILLSCALVGVALLLVWQRLRVVQLGYELSTTTKLERRLEQENRELRLELATLTSPERLEAMARRLGLREPRKGQVVVLP
jgi:cell division protein FtsL